MARNGNGNSNGSQQQAAATPAVQEHHHAPPAPRRSQPDALREMLNKATDRLARVLPKHLTPERMISVVSTLNYRTPKLQQCDPASILAAVMQSATLGLDLSPVMGEAYLVPRWNSKAGVNECHFQPGYKGLVKLARNSGAVVSIRAELVRQGDAFAYRYTPDLEFIHEPTVNGNPGPVTHAYAIAKLHGGEYQIEVMSYGDIEKIRARSQSPNHGPWATDWEEMARKTVLRRLCKRFPMSVEMEQALEAENREYTEVPGSPGEVVVRGAQTRGIAGLASRLAIEEVPLPPQPTRTYTEAEETEPVSAEDEAGVAEAASEAWDAGRE